MLIRGKSGNIKTASIINKNIDILRIEWYEATRRILHKQTDSGIAVTLKFLNENPNLKDGDILHEDENSIIAVHIIPCECIVMSPGTIITASSLCYEIGNRHLPLFYEEGDLLVPYDIPLFNLLEASGYQPVIELRKLSNAFKTSVLPHVQVADTGSLFTKISKLPTSL
ncbi:MAG: urease accessory protein UreE [Ginsengibacter sp.]